MKLVTDIFEYCNLNMKKWNTISISGYHIREAGSTAVQELAFTFSNAIEYTKAAIQQGLDVNVFTSQMSFFFNSHNNFFEEIAKFRAARKIWANIMKDRFGVTNKKGLMCRFHTQTAGSTLQAQQIDNNVVRTTMQAASAILGGTQSLHTNSKDEALSLPTEESAQLALRTQQILAHETGIPNVVDPLAGSYFIEDLTDKIELETLKLIKEVDNQGGAISAIENSFQQNEIANSSFDYQSDIESGKQTIVGVNKFKDTRSKSTNDLFPVDNLSAKEQLKRLKQFKKNRSLGSVQASLNELIKSLNSNKNLIPKIITCIKNSCTLGEICDVIKSKYGTY
jgi:methylmalonyl-CoA mutase N-terminal domain/subunit